MLQEDTIAWKKVHIHVQCISNNISINIKYFFFLDTT